MKLVFSAIFIACISSFSFGQIPNEYLPETPDADRTENINYMENDAGYVDVKSIPLPDCESFYQLYNFYYNKADLVFVIPDGTENSPEIERLKNGYSRFPNTCVFKNESELGDMDSTGLLVLHAPIHEYKHWERFNLPVLREKEGFSFRGQLFSDEKDGIFYLSPDVVAITGNSFAPIWNLYNSYCFLYKYILINDNIYLKYGLFNGHEIDLEAIRESNYNIVESEYFKLYISKSFGVAPDAYNGIVEQICKTMDLEPRDIKIQCMAHAEPNETRLFSNWFPYTGCDILADSMAFGASHNGVIHVIGNDKGLISHESFHGVWDQLVGIRNVFFAEGTQKYYEFLCDSTNIPGALEVMQRHKAYDLEPMILGNGFFSAPYENSGCVSYPISGLLSMYMVETYGLDTYKRLFTARPGKEGFADVFEISYDRLMTDFYSWIDTQ